MEPQGIGLNVDAGWLDGDLGRLEASLAHLAELAYDAAEIPPHGVDIIRCGQLDRDQVVSHGHDEGVAPHELASSIDGAPIAPLVVQVSQALDMRPITRSWRRYSASIHPR